jgi:hypothetical protein
MEISSLGTICLGNPNGKHLLQDMDINGKKILKLIWGNCVQRYAPD